MKILVLSPFGKTEPFGKGQTAGHRVRFRVPGRCLSLPYNTYVYNTLKCVNGAVERIIRAEQDGYDAAVISCMLDPGLMEARAIVDIPVTATFEASAHVAAMMGKRVSVVSADPMIVAFKMAEMMADMCRLAGYPAASRAGFYRKPPLEETAGLRKFRPKKSRPSSFITSSH